MAVVVATVRTTSIIPANLMPTCKFFTVTFFSSPCAIFSPARKSPLITNRLCTQIKKGASVEHLPVAELSTRLVGEMGKRGTGKGKERQSLLPLYRFPFSPVSVFQSLGKVKLNFDPRPTSESSFTVPPCCSTTSRTKDNPSPVDSSSFSCPSRTTR